MVEVIGIVLIIFVGCLVIAWLDWNSWNPPKWVVDFKMRRRK